MARFEFKLPDIGEGIAEAEIVAWHVKVGDTIGEDQQIADMMTDKATVEMESPVAGKVIELAGEVGDQVPIGSVLAVIETEGADRAAEPVADSEDERPLGDGAVQATPEQAKQLPVTKAVEQTKAVRPEPVEGPSFSSKAESSASTSSARTDASANAHVLASPAVRARARDLGIDLAQVKVAADRIRHADLDAFLLYNGGTVSARPASTPRKDDIIKVVGLRRKIAENMAEANRRIQQFTLVED
jgi:2-oxoisovalerate dehydrogenase E2 component (dihydrolipoyl transacylase)